MKPRLEDTSKIINSMQSNIGKDTRAQRKYISRGKSLNGSSTPDTTISKTMNIHPLPTKDPMQKAFKEYYRDKTLNQVIEDQYIDSVYHAAQLRESPDTPPQVRLQTCQMFINKVIGDKIDIKQTKIAVDVNKLLDQLSSIRAIVPDNSNDIMDIEND